MRIPGWRMVLTGSAITILAAAGIGLAAAGGPQADTTATAVRPVPLAPGARLADASGTDNLVSALAEDERLGRPGKGLRNRWLLRAGRHLVHAEVTITDREGKLVDLWFDHGTVTSITGATLVVAEAGGTTQSIKLDEATIVYVGRRDGALADVTAGREVFVQSRIVDGAAVAKRVLVVPADLE